MLAALLALCGLTWGFVELAELVHRGATQAFDEQIVSAWRNPDNPRLPLGPRWLVEAGRDVSALGGVTVLTLMTSPRPATWPCSAGASLGIDAAGRGQRFAGFDRVEMVLRAPRPAVGSDLAEVFTSSFPSGHSLLSAVVYLVLGTMLARTERRRAIKIYFITVAVLLTTLVG